MAAAKGILRYLKTFPDLGIPLTIDPSKGLEVFADASFSDHPDGKSSQGWIIFYAGAQFSEPLQNKVLWPLRQLQQNIFVLEMLLNKLFLFNVYYLISVWKLKNVLFAFILTLITRFPPLKDMLCLLLPNGLITITILLKISYKGATLSYTSSV